MGFIYKITNKVNGKGYIGKTERSVESRFKEHINDANKSYLENRPLYKAIQKYGSDSFYVETLEECEECDVREIFWIEYFNTFKGDGYNATSGGDGKRLLDYNLIEKYYLEHNQTKSIAQIAKDLNIDYSGLLRFLKYCGYNVSSSYRPQPTNNKKVFLVELNLHFNSLSEAAKFIQTDSSIKSPLKNIVEKISLCCRNKRKTAFGYQWKWTIT